MIEIDQFTSLEERYGARNYNPLDVVITAGRGVYLIDVLGHLYLDMLAGYSAVNQGHCHPKIVQALVDQSRGIMHCPRAFRHKNLGLFEEKLANLVGLDLVLPMNTGAEAVETAVKIARKWGYQEKGVKKNRAEIIVCNNNFHGRTPSAVSASTEKQYREGFGPYLPGFKHIPFDDTNALEKAITANTVGFLVEPVQGEGGINVPKPGFLAKSLEICHQYDTLLIADEIQTGFGRTGEMFAFEHDKIKPDLVIVGKALGGGYPVSAVIGRKDVMEVLKPGDHGSTFGGNPLACAVSIAAMEVVVQEHLADKAKVVGNYFREFLRQLNSPKVAEVRGKGLLIGVELTPESGHARNFVEKLLAQGILTINARSSVIRFTPPLVITKSHIDWAMPRIEKALS